MSSHPSLFIMAGQVSQATWAPMNSCQPCKTVQGGGGCGGSEGGEQEAGALCAYARSVVCFWCRKQ
jgi:hypothetical protein